MRLAVFASGRGSNMLAIHEAIESGILPGVSVALLVCDVPDAPVVGHASERGIQQYVFRAKDYPGKSAYESEIQRVLAFAKIDLVVLAGYMRIIGPTLLAEWEGRMINLHPSLLPEFPGADGIGDAIRAGVRETGVTVHFVDSGVDTGPIIAQSKVPVDLDDTVDSLAVKIHRVEHQLLPETISLLHRKGVEACFRKARRGSSSSTL